jgi:excisionase family DNA binding protein
MDERQEQTQSVSTDEQVGGQADKPRLLKVHEALEYMGGAMGRDTFYGKLRNGEVKSIKAGNRFLIPVKALDKFLEGYQ